MSYGCNTDNIDNMVCCDNIDIIINKKIPSLKMTGFVFSCAGAVLRA